jgi:hypothetical protein
MAESSHAIGSGRPLFTLPGGRFYNATKPLEGRILDMTTDDIQVVLQPRNATIGELVEACAKGDLAFSGPDSLCAKVAAMGFKTTSLYEMVMAYRAALSPQP